MADIPSPAEALAALALHYETHHMDPEPGPDAPLPDREDDPEEDDDETL
jgi:hypothetical protein